MSSIVSTINNIMLELNKNSLLFTFNPAIKSGTKISWRSDLSLSKYFGISNQYLLYREFIKNNDYIAILNDGSLIQMFYEYDKKERNIINHRLLFFHFPILDSDAIKLDDFSIEDYLNSLEEVIVRSKHGMQVKSSHSDELNQNSENDNISLYFRIDKIQSVGFIRLDFDPDGANTATFDHPVCHMTINQNGVRIPVCKGIKPEQFIRFIMKHYYHYDLESKYNSSVHFAETIESNEKLQLHFNIQ